MKKTHHCNQLRKVDAQTGVILVGWIDSMRDHGGILFVDLRDREGLTQAVFDPNQGNYRKQLDHLRPESVIEVSGVVKLRSEETINLKIATGEVEVHVSDLIIHSISKTPPFPIDQEKSVEVSEELRLRYRYLDIRRPENLAILRRRHQTCRATRNYLDGHGFVEVETPLLFKSTPEGAREFLVPSRLNPGGFYALIQSPQQFKQMLMVSGIERYYQIAKCFRDEDLRADRQAEFTQIDIELSFIDREDLYRLIEGLFHFIWKEILGVEVSIPFRRISYREAMNRYGIDKPDTRFALELVDLSEIFKDSEFRVFARVIETGGVVKAINAKGLADVTQGELRNLEEAAVALGAKGLAFIKVEAEEWKSPILKFLSEAEKAALRDSLDMCEGDIVFFAASEWEDACTILGRIRNDCAQYLKKRGKLILPSELYHFLWVTDFPLILFDQETGQYASAHHPFTSPIPEDIPLIESDPKKVRGQHYDIVLNGVELGGGSIRIHNAELQRKVFEEVLRIPPTVVQDRFGYMLESFRYGAPPHGGIAIGFDRLVAMLCGKSSIRDVIAFPKTQKGQCLMSNSPSPATEKQLRDLHITTVD